VIVDANFYLEIRDFLLCAGPSRFSGVRDLLNDTFDLRSAVRVDFDVCLIPKFHVHDIIFVYVHDGLHVAEIGDSHHIGPGKIDWSRQGARLVCCLKW